MPVAIDKKIKKRQWLLYAIIITLIFEGLLRKIAPSALGLVIFFLKDLLCIISLFIVVSENIKGGAAKLFRYWKIVLLAFIPVLLITALYDPILFFFGLKQYLLYVVAGVLVPLAFPPGQQEAFKRFVFVFVLMLIPTTLIAVLQNALPPTHWLNLSVTGDSLEMFSSAGYLRVSSTFSFSGQYAFFLNAISAFLGAAFFLKPKFNVQILKAKLFQKYILFILSFLLLIGSFITGGRTAVLGCAACLLIGTFFAAFKSPKLIVTKGTPFVALMLVMLVILQNLKPEFFAAYNKRTENTADHSSKDEFSGRVQGNFLGWTDWAFDQDFLSLIFGNGLGVMSNGSDKVSKYAYSVRSTGFWTEADIPTTVWEGGIYLFVVWYGFRLSILIMCIRLWSSMRTKIYAFAASFLMGIIVLNGVFGTLSIQPPVAIWWWLSVGTLITLKGFDQQKRKIKIAIREDSFSV